MRWRHQQQSYLYLFGNLPFIKAGQTSDLEISLSTLQSSLQPAATGSEV